MSDTASYPLPMSIPGMAICIRKETERLGYAFCRAVDCTEFAMPGKHVCHVHRNWHPCGWCGPQVYVAPGQDFCDEQCKATFERHERTYSEIKEEEE